jgi:quercetin dioxygenase-like cupin family protein
MALPCPGADLCVTEGVGRCQRRGGPIEIIRPGDSVYFEPGEDHRHGAAPDRFMTHLAMREVDAGSVVTWGEHVSDEDYSAEPSTEA